MKNTSSIAVAAWLGLAFLVCAPQPALAQTRSRSLFEGANTDAAARQNLTFVFSAAESYDDGIAVNVLSPSGLVATPGVVHHGLDRIVPPEAVEPVECMTDAALALCTGDPATLTGRVAYAKPLLAELGG